MPQNAAWLVLAAVLAVLLIATCIYTLAAFRTPDATEPSAPLMELRSYRVPAGYEDETKGVLRYVLQTTENAHGRVSMGPGGQLVVLAPESVHRGVEALLKQIGDQGLRSRSVPATIAMDYWFVVGRPDDTAPEASLPTIAPALAEVSKRQGPMKYVLLEHLRVLGKENARSHAMGAHFGAEQEASLAGDRIIASVQLLRGTSLRTEVNLEPGQLLVLAQSGYSGPLVRGDGIILLVIVRAELLSAHG